jgi:hypothetical protein
VLFENLIDIVKEFGVIEHVKQKLISQPDPASEHLISILDEISKIYRAFNSEITDYLKIRFDINERRQNIIFEGHLIDLEGGGVWPRVDEARGHCEKIINVYKKFLKGWFSRVLDKDKAKMLEDIFMKLHDFDSGMLNGLEKFSKWLVERAQNVLKLIDEDKFQEVNTLIKQDRVAIRDDRQALSRAIQQLYKLQSEFIIISGAV